MTGTDRYISMNVVIRSKTRSGKGSVMGRDGITGAEVSTSSKEEVCRDKDAKRDNDDNLQRDTLLSLM